MVAIAKGNLVLSRKFGESISIGDDIEVKILRNAGGVVRIAVEAPKHIRVLRSELKQNRT